MICFFKITEQKRWLIDWRGYLAIGIFCIVSAPIATRLGTNQRYNDFIVGNIAWQSVNKTVDFYVIALFLILFFGAVVGFNRYLSSLKEKSSSNDLPNDLQFLMLLASFPGIWLIGRSIYLKPPVPVALLVVSALLVLLVVAFSALWLWLYGNKGPEGLFLDVVAGSVSILIGAIFGGSAISTILVRGFLVESAGSLEAVGSITAVLFGVCATLLVLTWCKSKDVESLRQRIFGLVLFVQLFLAGLYLMFIPPPWLVDGMLHRGYQPSLWLWGGVAVLVIATVFDIGKRILSWRGCSRRLSLDDIFSSLALISIVIFLKLPWTGIVNIPNDDYHFGENLLPGFLWAKHGLRSFIEYEPARGLFQTHYGILANLFFDGSAAAVSKVVTISGALFFVLLMLSLAPLVGTIGAFFIALLTPFLPAWQFLVITVGVFALLHPKTIRNGQLWIVIWSATTILFLLASPQYGPAYGLGTSAAALYVLFIEYKSNPRRFGVFLAILSVSAAAILLVTPLGVMCYGCVRYIIENLSINQTANGVVWAGEWNIKSHPFGALLWEFARVSWIAVLLFVFILFVRRMFYSTEKMPREHLLGLIMWGAILLLLIPYGFGRIDPRGFSRVGTISAYAVAIVLPFLCFWFSPRQVRSFSLIGIIVLVSVVSPGGNLTVKTWKDFLRKPVQRVYVDKDRLVEGAKVGLPQLGKVYMEEAHYSRLSRLKETLGLLLKPGETYLDLTNRQAHYFYLDLAVPMQSGAVYNLPGEAMQLRALEKTISSQVPIVLVDANNILHDGGPVSLRSYLFYREYILNYVPVFINDFVFLVEKGRVPFISNLVRVGKIKAEFASLELLNSIFAKPNLALLPVAWGKSFTALESKLTGHISLDASPKTMRNLKNVDGWFVPERQDPAIVFNISGLGINGRDAGMLHFDFTCQSKTSKPVMLEVYWKPSLQQEVDETTVVRFLAEDGKVVVPMDISPKWLLADKIDKLRVDLKDYRSCEKFSFKNIVLSQRTASLKADGISRGYH